MNYQLFYVDGEWVVDSYYEQYWFNGDNTQEFSNDGTSESLL